MIAQSPQVRHRSRSARSKPKAKTPHREPLRTPAAPVQRHPVPVITGDRQVDAMLRFLQLIAQN